MRFPPLNYEDLVAMGCDPMTSWSFDGGVASASPEPPRLVSQLVRELLARPTPEGDQMAYLRHVRDVLIGLTDWTQATDSPLSEEQRQAWAAYRQSLRDLPESWSGDGTIPWPQIP
jgi:hypothetical protein